MPASTVDTFIACSIMTALILSSMLGLPKVLHPYLSDFSPDNKVERYQQLARYLLLSTGTPSDWGIMSEVVPSSFGLSSVNSIPYELDIDKVSRLNEENAYAINYSQLLKSLGISDVALRIEIKTLFDLSLNLTSSLTEEDQTTYNFSVSTKKSGLPLSAQLRCYIVVKNYVYTMTASTTSTGEGSMAITIPNSANGTALLIALASAKPRMMAFSIYPFGHNSSNPEPNGTFMKLTPLNYVLNASFSFPQEEVLRVQVFTYRYSFNLTKIASGSQTAEYEIPRILDPSPMILVITGFNESSSFAEWVAYPQLPIEIGANLRETSVVSEIVSLTYVVAINSVLYEFKINCRSPF